MLSVLLGACGAQGPDDAAPPTADAGIGFVAHVGTQVFLDGTKSHPAGGEGHDDLSFDWAFGHVPDGSQAVLGSADSPFPYFTVDMRGSYQIRLVVTDKGAESQPDVVEVRGYQPLSVLSQSPPVTSTIARPEAPVVAVFSEPVQPDTVAVTSVYLLPEGSREPRTGTLSLAQGNTMVVFVPDAPLPRGRAMTLVITREVMSLAGVGLAADYRGTFIVSASTRDRSRPRVIAVEPAEESTDVALTQPVALTFSEPIDPTTVSVSTIAVTEGTAPVPGVLEVAAAGVQVTFSPTAAYSAGTEYTVLATEGVRDRSGNPLDGAGSNGPSGSSFVSTFRTVAAGNRTPPAVISIYPGDGFRDVPTAAAVAVELSAPVDVSTVTATTALLEGATGPVPVVLSFQRANRVVVLEPELLLALGTTYTVTLTGAVEDVLGTVLDGDGDGQAGGVFSSVFTTTATSDVLELDVVPDAPRLHAGEVVQLRAIATFGDGAIEDLTGEAEWSSAIPSIVGVDSAGLASGLTAGSTSVRARRLGIEGSETITVFPVVGIAPSTVTVPPRGSVVFVPGGGNGTFVFSVAVDNSGATINAATGAYTAGSTGNVTDTVRVTDGIGGTAEALVTVGPEIAISPVTAAASPLESVTFSAQNGDGNYVFTLSDNQSGGSIHPSTGVYRAGPTGSVIDTVRATDGLGASAEATVTVGTALQLSPGPSVTVIPLGTISFSATGGDGSYTYSVARNDSGGGIVADTGVYTAGPTGGVTDLVRVTDGFGAQSDVTVTVSGAVSIAPSSVTLIPLQGQSFSATGGDGNYTFSLRINNSGGSVGASSGEYVAGPTGGVTDTVQVTDGRGGISQATVTLGPAVSISPSTITLAPLEPFSFSAAGGDGTYAFSIVINNSGSTIDPVTGDYTAGPIGNVIDTVRVMDGLGGVATATANIGGALLISPTNASVPPLSSISFLASGGEGTYTYSLLINNSGGSIDTGAGAYIAGPTGGVTDTIRVTDDLGSTSTAVVIVTAATRITPALVSLPPRGIVDFSATGGNGVYTYSLSTNNSGGTINDTTGVYVAGPIGRVADTVRVTDGLGGFGQASINVGPPVDITPDSANRPPLGTVSFSATGGDGSFTFSLAVNESGGSINPATGAYVAGPVGSVNDVVRVTDGLGSTNDATVAVGPALAVLPLNPSIAPTGSIPFVASGGDGVYTFSFVSNSSGGTVNASTGAYVAGATGNVTDTIRVTDGRGATRDTVVTVTSTLALSPQSPSIAPRGSIVFSASGGNGAYSYSLLLNNSGASIDAGTGIYVAGPTGSVTDTVRVLDGLGVSRNTTVVVTAALTIAPTTVSRAPRGTVAFVAGGGSGTYTFELLVDNSGGSISAATGAYVAGATGNVADTVRVTDSFGAARDATVNLTQATTIAPASFSTPPLGGTTFTASGGDGSFTFSLVANASGGSVHPSTGVYTAGPTGGVTDTVRVTDGLGGTKDASVTVGPAIAISPITISRPPLGGTTFTASGGGGAYTYSLAVNQSGGSINAASGAYAAGVVGTVTDTVRVTDGLGAFAEATVGVSAAVALNPSVATLAPTGTLVFSASGGAGGFTFSLLSNNSGGTIHSLTGAYAAGPTGSVTDTVRVRDSLGAQAQATITVGPVLSLAPASSSSPPGGSVVLSAAGGGGSYNYEIITNNSGGTIGVASGLYTAGATGGVSDTVRVFDGLGVSADATVNVGDSTRIAPATTSVAPLSSITFTGGGGDGSYLFSFVTNASLGSIDPVTGVYVAGPVGDVTDTVQVTDGLGFTADATIAVGPEVSITPSSLSRPPRGTATFVASGGDGSYTFSFVTNASGGTVGAVTGAYTAGATGSVSDVIRVTDGGGGSMDATITVTAALAISPPSLSTPPLGGTTFSGTGGNGTYTFSISNNPSGATINALTGVYAAGATGGVTDTVRVTDGLGSTAAATVTVGPSIIISPATVNLIPLQGQSFTATGGNGSYTYSLSNAPSGGSIHPVTGAYVSGPIGDVTDTVRVVDGLGGVSVATVTLGPSVSVSPVSVTVAPNDAASFSAAGGDGSYTFSIFDNRSGGTIDPVTGDYVAGSTGSVLDTVRVTDGLGGFADAIANVGGVVTITPSSATLPPLGTRAFTASGGSPGYTYSIVINNSGGSINSVTGVYVAGPVGSVVDTVRVTDSLSATSDANVTVTTALAIAPATIGAPPRATVAFSASGGNGSYTYSLVANNSGASINASTGSYTAGSIGSVVDTVRVIDGLGASRDATVNVGPVVSIAPSSAAPPPLGTVSFSASGGNGNYTYAIWVNNSGGSVHPTTGLYTAGGIGSVSDTVRVIDGLGTTADATVNVGSGLTLTPVGPSVAPTATVSFVAGGGGGGYTFSISINASGATINASSGFYTAGPTGSVSDRVRVTDGLGVFKETEVTVTAALLVSPATASVPPRGASIFSASGGQAPYTFSLPGNNSGGTINPATGAYTAGATGNVTDSVQVTDNLGVMRTASVTVTPAVAIIPALASRPPLGTLDFNASGGNGTYTFSLVANNSGGSINATTGEYTAGLTGSVADTVRVTDGLGEHREATVNVTASLSITPATFSTPPLGGTTFSGTGGGGSYTYSLQVNNSGGSINASSGVYVAGPTGNVSDTVRVTDGLGSIASATATVTAGVAITPSSATTPPLGTVSFSGSGGNGSYTFSLPVNNSGGSINAVSGAYTAGPTGSVADTVRITDGLGATRSATVTVGPALALSPASTSVAPVGSLVFSSTGGNGSYTYSLLFNNSGGSIGSTSGAYTAGSTGSVTDTVRVTDGLGATRNATVTVGPVLAISPTSPSRPPGGSVAFTASGGGGGYTFTIVTNGSGASINSTTGAYTAGTTGSVTDTVRVTDGLGVTATATVSIGPTLSISPTSVSVPPRGGAVLSGVGGAGSYTYSLLTNNSGASIDSVSGAYVAGSTGSVTDTVRVTDGLGFTANATVSVGPVVSIAPASSSVPPLGTVGFSAAGGGGSYTFSILVNNSGGNINATSGAYVAGPLGSVNDTVRVTDGLGATANATVAVTTMLAISPSVFTTPPRGGTTFVAGGGNGTYTFSLPVNNSGGSIGATTGLFTAGNNGSVSDTVRVTDGLGATRDASVTVSAAVAISPSSISLVPLRGQTFAASGGNGAYVYSLVVNNSGGSINTNTGAYVSGATGNVTDTVRVTDGLGGFAQATITLSPDVAISPTSVTLAPGESQTFTASGGDGSYTFSISGNASGGTIHPVTGAYIAGVTGSVLDTIRVTDGLGGFDEAVANVGGVVTLTPATVTRAPLGTALFSGSGGSPPYTFSLVTNNSGGSINSGTGAYSAGPIGSVVDTVRITDGVLAMDEAVITVTAATQIAPAIVSAPPLGAVSFTTTGGTGTYTYSLLTNNSGASINPATGAYTAGATGGVTDTVRVTDGNGATSGATINVGPAIGISPSAASSPPFGSVSFSSTGGSGNYTYSLPVNNSGGSVNPTTGAYTAGPAGSVSDTVRVTDGVGATKDATVTVGPSLDILPHGPSVAPSGGIAFSATGGNGVYTYSLVTNSSGASIVAGTGAYTAGTTGGVNDTVRVTDGLGVTRDSTVTVTAALSLSPLAPSSAPLGFITFTASGGNPPYAFSLLVVSSGGSINSTSGQYRAGTTGNVTDTVRVTDSLGVTRDTIVSISSQIVIAPTSVSRPPLDTVSFSAAGGSGSYTYSLLANNSGGSIHPSSGAYIAGPTGNVTDTVRVVDSLSATATASVNVSAATAIAPSSFTTPPLGGTTFSAGGGNGSYTFALFVNNSGGTLNSSTGIYTAGPTGNVTDTVRATDGLGGISNALVTITTAIAISPAARTLSPLSTMTFTASGGNGSYTYSLLTNNSGASINSVTGAYTAGSTNGVTDTVRVTDGLGGASLAVVTVQALSLSPAVITTSPSAITTFSGSGGAGSYTYSLLVNNSGGSINASTGAYTAGSLAFVTDTVRVTDGLGATANATADILTGPVLFDDFEAPGLDPTVFASLTGDGLVNGDQVFAGASAVHLGGLVSGTQAILTTVSMDTSSCPQISWSFYGKRGPSSPDEGDSLQVEYFDTLQAHWITVDRWAGATGGGTDTGFTFRSGDISAPGALYGTFALRIVGNVSDAGDDFYVDDFALSCSSPDSDDDGVTDALDCADSDPWHWSDCGSCTDGDGDGRGLGCNAGADCAASAASHWADCGTCGDGDGDGYGTGCDLGADCDDVLSSVSPAGTDLTIDGTDQDCDGYDGWRMYDDFDTGDVDPDVFWLLSGDTHVGGYFAHSGGYMLNTGGGGAQVYSAVFDASTCSSIDYSVRIKRGPDMPGTGDTLSFQYRTAALVWTTVFNVPTTTSADPSYLLYSGRISNDNATHPASRLRFFGTGDGWGTDDYYIDDVDFRINCP